MATERLKELLDESRVKYTVLHHSRAFTAQEIAAASHVSGKELAKTVIVQLDGELAMVVLPAPALIDWERLAEVAGAKEVAQAHEPEFRDRFPDCEVGAMPPIGSLYGMRVFVDEGLAGAEEIAFNAGTHRELVRMPFRDLVRLTRPVMGRIAVST